MCCGFLQGLWPRTPPVPGRAIDQVGRPKELVYRTELRVYKHLGKRPWLRMVRNQESQWALDNIMALQKISEILAAMSAIFSKFITVNSKKVLKMAEDFVPRPRPR